MAWPVLDKFRRHFFLKTELRRKLLKSLLKDKTLPYKYRLYFQVRSSFQRTIASTNKHRSRCLVTGRVHNVLKKVAYSRFVLRKEANFGLLPGMGRLSK